MIAEVGIADRLVGMMTATVHTSNIALQAVDIEIGDHLADATTVGQDIMLKDIIVAEGIHHHLQKLT